MVTSVAVASVQGLSLVTTLVLARLLSPAEVGAYAAGTVLTYLFVSFADGGMREALVQREDGLADTATTVFWATAAGGVLMCLGALAAAPVVGLVFDSAQIGTIAALTAGMLLVEALTNVPNGLLQRRFDMRRKTIADPLRAVVFASVTIALAATGFGVWSLVIGNYAALVAWSVVAWALARWRPGSGRFSLPLWRELARFAAPLLVHSVSAYARGAAESVLVGRWLGAGSLGNYRYGSRLAALPTIAIVEVGSYLLLPAFSRLAGEPARFRAAFLRALRWMWFLAVPTAALFALCGEQAVTFVLGEAWRDAGLLLVPLGGVALGMALQAVGGEAIKASGRSRAIAHISVVQLVLGVVLLLLLLPAGLLGVGLAVSVTELATGLLVLALVRPVVGLAVLDLARALVPMLCAGALALAAAWPLRLVLESAGTPVLVDLGAEIVAFAAAYLLALFVLDRPLATGLIQLVVKRVPLRRPLPAPVHAANAEDVK